IKISVVYLFKMLFIDEMQFYSSKRIKFDIKQIECTCFQIVNSNDGTMKRLFTLFAAMVCASASSQLYVGPNSYMYVNDQIVYVKQDINLQNNGNIYLRREAQLLQGTTGSSTNQGARKLSVYQEGT